MLLPSHMLQAARSCNLSKASTKRSHVLPQVVGAHSVAVRVTEMARAVLPQVLNCIRHSQVVAAAAGRRLAAAGAAAELPADGGAAGVVAHPGGPGPADGCPARRPQLHRAQGVPSVSTWRSRQGAPVHDAVRWCTSAMSVASVASVDHGSGEHLDAAVEVLMSM